MAIKRRNKRSNPYKVAALSMGFVAVIVLPLSIALGGQVVAGLTMAIGTALLLGVVAASS